jgi:hypothetical protein
MDRFVKVVSLTVRVFARSQVIILVEYRAGAVRKTLEGESIIYGPPPLKPYLKDAHS